MFKDLLINMAFLISTITILNQSFKAYDVDQASSLHLKIFKGLITGFLGILLMLFGLRVNNTIIDLRYLAIMIVIMQGDIFSAMICGLMIAGFRVLYYGLNPSSIAGGIMVMIVILGCWFITTRKINFFQKWLLSTVLTVVSTHIAYVFLLNENHDLFLISGIYWVSSFSVSLIIYYNIKYHITSHELFYKCQIESTKDFLTGLNNVRQFDAIYNHALKNALEKEEYLSLLMIDIDFFKKVNDTYGHKEGDLVLQELGQILIQNCRTFDEVSRNGGEEFSVLLLDCPHSQAMKIAERIRLSVETHTFVLSTGKQIAITVSIGAATFPETVPDIEKLVESADTALYTAKRTGRNKVCSIDSCS